MPSIPTQWSNTTTNATNWGEQDLLPIPGNLLLENSFNILQEDNSSKINLE